MDLIFQIVATICFAVGFVLSVMSLRSRRPHLASRNLILIGIGFIAQCAFLHQRGELHGKCPITDGAERLIFVAWSLSIMYFVLGRAFRLSLVGVFTAPILALLHLIALILNLVNPVVARPVDSIDPWLEMHAAMSMLAYGAFAFASISAIMYLVQNRQLKSGHPGHLSFSLPPIQYLAEALVRLLLIGLFLLTVGVVSALFMQKSPSTMHFSLFGGVWIIYTIVVVYHFIKRPAAKWLSFASLVAFCFALLTLSAI